MGFGLWCLIDNCGGRFNYNELVFSEIEVHSSTFGIRALVGVNSGEKLAKKTTEIHGSSKGPNPYLLIPAKPVTDRKTEPIFEFCRLR